MNLDAKITVSTPEAGSSCAFVAVDVESTTTLPRLLSEMERRGDYERQSIAINALEPSIQRPSLPSQIAARRKLLAILTAQFGIVCLAAVIVRSGSLSVRDWFEDTFSTFAAFVVIAGGYIVMLIALHCARAKSPLNWILLAIFTVFDVLSFIMIEVSTDTPFTSYTLVYVWLCIAFMLGGASLTTTTTGAWWSGLSLRASSAMDEERRMVSPAVPGVVGLLVGLVVVLMIGLIGQSTQRFYAGFWVVVGTAVFVCGIFFIQLSRNKAPHEYMRGVVYLHVTLLLAFVVLVVILFIILASSDLS